uniref:Putative B-box zinc finger protein 21 n=1 Tax=Davidia involucrata TaxID=16924 RepID=A0A5B6ZYX1_DAVIN
MKIQCDVCNRDGASVFCSADEAALCDACDHRIHHANKLAGKHQRFSLLPPSPKQAPLCDICRERKAFLFCQQDRAILCRDCDISIHKANEHAQKHNRFLLTGIKLSALYSPSPSPSPSSSLTKECDSASPEILNPPSIAKTISTTTTTTVDDKGGGQNQLSSGSTSSISEYLIEMLPGWHVEDFLDDSPFGFCKAVDDVMPIWDANFDSSLSSFSSENMGIWVPQAQLHPSSNMAFGEQIGFKEATNTKSSRKWRDNGCFTVPQISPPSKRSTTFW